MKNWAMGLAVSGFLASNLAQSATLLHCGQLIDVESLKVLQQQTVRVVGNTIQSVTPGYAATAEGDETVDLKQATCMPGLMDMHVHLAHQFSGNH